jgi:hypothetical protein
MDDEAYYRRMAAHARRLAEGAHQEEMVDLFSRVAQDYEEIADDLRDGSKPVRHRELMGQLGRHR